MKKKFNKTNSPEWFTESHEILYVDNSSKVEHLFKLYEKDKYLARVVYMNDSIGYENFRLVIFKEKNGNFQIVWFRKKFGISTTNRIYNSEKRLLTITYKEGKFWLIDNTGPSKKVRPLTINFLHNVFPHYQLGMNESKQTEAILNKLESRFTWIRFIREHKVLTNTAFNTIIKNKLFNLKKALQFEYKVPKPVALLIHKSDSYWVKCYFKYYLPYVKNVESLKPEWLVERSANSQLNLFKDTLNMAKILDEKVNCSWSNKRLREEHDYFVKVINDIIFIGAERQMKISKVYLDFAEFSKFEMIKSTKEIAYEGKKQNHCVGTYVNKVENGNCAIYRINNHTLELNSSWDGLLKVGQLRGYANAEPPKELFNKVVQKVIDFNNSNSIHDLSQKELYDFVTNNNNWSGDLPF